MVTSLEGRRVGLHSLHEQLDACSPGGQLVFHLSGALTEFERDLIRERTHAGLAAPSPGSQRRSSHCHDAAEDGPGS